MSLPPTAVVCFIVERTGRVRMTLRQYSSEKCPETMKNGFSGHTASVSYGERMAEYSREGYLMQAQKPAPGPLWPDRCDRCGAEFAAMSGVNQVVDQDEIMRGLNHDGQPNGLQWPRRELPGGAMYDCWWWPEKGPDGKWWCLKLPGGAADEWHVYGKAASGGTWTVTGVAPKLTARPSILSPNYHGFLTDGILVAC